MGPSFRGVQNGLFRTLKCTCGVSGFRGSVAGRGVCNAAESSEKGCDGSGRWPFSAVSGLGPFSMFFPMGFLHRASSPFLRVHSLSLDHETSTGVLANFSREFANSKREFAKSKRKSKANNRTRENTGKVCWWGSLGLQIGGVYATLCQKEGILLQKYRDRNGRCIAILFRSIRVRGRCDSPDILYQTT